MNDTNKSYLVYSREHNAFWKPNSRGYTTLVEEAGRYSLEEAQDICTGANYGLDARSPNEVIVGDPNVVGLCESFRVALEAIAEWAKGDHGNVDGSFEEDYEHPYKIAQAALSKAKGEQP